MKDDATAATWQRAVALAADLVHKLRAHPVSFLGLVSAACIVLGLVQFAVAVAILAPADFAVIGVLMAASGFVANLVDLRTIDLATRLYFAVPQFDNGGRTDVLAAGALVQLILGLVVAALTAPVILSGASTPLPEIDARQEAGSVYALDRGPPQLAQRGTDAALR